MHLFQLLIRVEVVRHRRFNRSAGEIGVGEVSVALNARQCFPHDFGLRQKALVGY